MYAVIATGGKQHRVVVGQRVDVERLGQPDGSDVSLAPVLVVDGDTVLATPAQLVDVSVTGRLVGRSAGPKIAGFTYKNATTYRRRWGHRQHYDTVEITEISTSG